MPAETRSEPHIPVKFTQAQRTILAELLPALADRLKCHEPGQRTLTFTPAELSNVVAKADAGMRQATSGVRRNSLRHILLAIDKALARFEQAAGVYQITVTLIDTRPPIWRRFRTHDCTLDELHEHIQMGWTNSHLHQFRVGQTRYGDPDLLVENFEEFGYEDSATTRLSEVVPAGGKPFRFHYEYDFGDSWNHEVLVEAPVPAESGIDYPQCVGGERACPPEDVGGVGGYAEFLDAIGKSDHERHREMLEWVGGRFDPQAFDRASATRRMRRGLPDSRDGTPVPKLVVTPKLIALRRSSAPTPRPRPTPPRSSTPTSRPSFVALRVVPDVPLEVVLRSGHVLRVPLGYDANHLRVVVAALEALPC